MSTLQSLLVLLVVAYMGGFLMGGRGLRGRGLPSGSEWLVLGFVAGPSALGLLGGAEVAYFAPVVLLASGWIALLVGVTFGVDGDRRIPVADLALGLLSGLLSLGAVAGAVWLVLERVPGAGELVPDGESRRALALCTGAALSDTSRHAARWAAERLGASGPLIRRIAGVTRSDDLVAIAAVSVVISADASRGVPPVPFGGFALGAALGLLFAALLGRAFRRTVFWSLAFGFSLLATGTAERVDVSVLSAGFTLGLALALVSPRRAEARTAVGDVEGAVVLPALFLAGTRTEVPPAGVLWIVAAALAARVVASVLTAGLVAALDRDARRAGPALALAFLAPGPLGVAVAVAVQLRYPGPLGAIVLPATLAAAVLGEFVGPPALRRALRRAGEIPA